MPFDGSIWLAWGAQDGSPVAGTMLDITVNGVATSSINGGAGIPLGPDAEGSAAVDDGSGALNFSTGDKISTQWVGDGGKCYFTGQLVVQNIVNT